MADVTASPRIGWRGVAVIVLTLALAWALRGEHGHERGAAMVGALAGLSVAAVTGNPAWIGAAVLGSLGFAVGGALSFGALIDQASHGALEAIAGLVLVGMSWGALGFLALRAGPELHTYPLSEKLALGAALAALWRFVDVTLWDWLRSREDLMGRAFMGAILLLGWVLICLYLLARRRQYQVVGFSLLGAISIGAGFVLMPVVYGAGGWFGSLLHWERTAHHVVGLLAGLALVFALRIFPLETPSRPSRWYPLALLWLFWLMPSWLMANNLDYWVNERHLMTASQAWIIAGGLWVLLACMVPLAWRLSRQPNVATTMWSPGRLTQLFLGLLWIATALAGTKQLAAGVFSLTPAVFVALAAIISWLVTGPRPLPGPHEP